MKEIGEGAVMRARHERGDVSKDETGEEVMDRGREMRQCIFWL